MGQQLPDKLEQVSVAAQVALRLGDGGDVKNGGMVGLAAGDVVVGVVGVVGGEGERVGERVGARLGEVRLKVVGGAVTKSP